jgi:predicted metal-dependent hydrolase
MIHEETTTVVALCGRQKRTAGGLRYAKMKLPKSRKKRKDALRKRLNEAMRRKSTQAE